MFDWIRRALGRKPKIETPVPPVTALRHPTLGNPAAAREGRKLAEDALASAAPRRTNEAARPAAAPPSQPAYAKPAAAKPALPRPVPLASGPAQPVKKAAPAQVARITVILPHDRAVPGTLTATDAAGNPLSGPWPALGRADDGLASTRGNPGRNPLHPFGDTPTGEFEVVGRLPAHEDPRAREIFGNLGALTIRPASGQAMEADANGRTQFLIHGGPTLQAATDGSIRIPDEAMTELLSLMPANPGAARPRIRVLVGEASAERADWSPTSVDRAQIASVGARAYASARTYSGYTAPTRTETVYVQNNNPLPGYYWWYLLQDTSGGSTGYRCAPEPERPSDWQTDGDRAAAANLGDLGYQVQPDGDLQRDAPPARDEPPSVDARTESNWAPSGNAYDR